MSPQPGSLSRLSFRALGSLADIQIYQELMAKSRSRPPKADAKLQVIGAGFSKTATLSMYAAMLELGYKCYHGLEMECSPGVADRWIRVLEYDLAKGSTEGIDWLEVTQGYDAGFDGPLADYWLELSRAFPDAKIIYTYRDGHRWIESYNATIIRPMVENIWFRMASVWFGRQAKCLKAMQLGQAKYKRDFGGLAPDLIDKRLEAIRAEIAPERLLVSHPSEGWEPLCKFLGVPIPDVPFPKINDGPSMVWALRALSVVGMAFWGATLAIAAGACLWLYSWVP